MKNSITLLASALVLYSSPSCAQKPSSPVFNESIIARIDCVDKKAEGVGTAWRIADGRYITAGHVAKMAGTCTVGGGPMKVEIIDDAHDIAIVDGPLTGGPVAKLSCDDFDGDKDYVAIGYAFGDTELTIEPLIAAPIEVDGYRALVGEVIPGMSGGPVYGYDGKVHGIVNMRWPARVMSLAHTFMCKRP